ncbi:enoyl-CoA hydratase-related protein [Sphingomonas sp. ID0503]|uniref:enoyl-CoA hydratase-related protein n=1 Tax=Sphingomonas sp. ID0503 TaxID=3399691 RepID=UPI003AFA356F
MSGYRFISTRREGHALIVRIQRPEVMNALHSPAHFEMADAFDAFAADDDLRVAIVTGAGERAFSAGNDLKHHAAGGSLEMPASGFAGLTRRFDLAKPVIAAVNGLALGGGFETALACDIIVAGEHARFGLPEPKVGLAALAGGLFRLPQAIGIKRAMTMILTARQVSACDGRELGFVSEVVEPGGELDRALAIAGEIAVCSPAAIRAAKATAMRGLDIPIAESIDAQFDWPEVSAMRASPDAIEGPRAFAEKRAPRWN